jgi:hypothetical protein
LAAKAAILKRRAVFELPRKLGTLQYVEYEPLPKEWCTEDGCFYEGLLTAEGSRRGICVRYRVWVYSRDKRRWEAKEKWRRRDEEAGGCIKQQVADALWELAEKYDVGVWYKRVEEKVGIRYEVHVYCGPVVNGVLYPYMVEAYVAKDGSEVCPSLNPLKAFCAQNGSVKETRSLSSAGTRHTRKG